MKKHFPKTALMASLVIGSLIGSGFVDSSNAEAQLKVGLILPKSSVFAVLGSDIDDGFMFALKEAGMEDQFEIFREDTEVKPPVGLAKTRKLVLENEVDVLVGVVSSGVLAAMRDFVHNSETPLIVANAGNIHATGEQCSPYMVRVSFSNAQMNRPMGQWLYDQGIKKVYTLGPDYSAGHQMIETFSKAYKAAGGEIVGGEFTPFRTTKDFGPYLTSVRPSGAEALFVFYSGSEAIDFVKQYDSFGMKDAVPLYGSGFLTSPLYVGAQGDAAVGVTTSLHYVPTLDNPENNKFVANFTKEFGRTPSEYTTQGYDAAKMLLGAMANGANDRESIARALPTVKYVGPRGPMRIDPKTNNVIQNIYIYETIKTADGYSQRVLDKVDNVQDPINGCQL